MKNRNSTLCIHFFTVGIFFFIILSVFSFAAFNQYRIPRINLLDRFGDVTPDGKYVTPFKVRVHSRLDQPENLGVICLKTFFLFSFMDFSLMKNIRCI